jgi:hypothetical protein
MGTRRGGAGSLEEIGRPSEVALKALEHIDETDAAPPAERTAAEIDAAAADGGRSIWRDLPSTGSESTAEDHHEEGPANGR